MAGRANYRLGRDVGDDEVLRDRKGNVVDDRYAEEASADALRKVRSRGRPFRVFGSYGPLAANETSCAGRVTTVRCREITR